MSEDIDAQDMGGSCFDMDTVNSSVLDYNSEMDRLIKFLDHVSQSKDLQAMSVGLSAVDVLIWNNPLLLQFFKDTTLGITIGAWSSGKSGPVSWCSHSPPPPYHMIWAGEQIRARST